MMNDDMDEKTTAEAFNRQSEVFDSIYNGNEIIQYKRKRTRHAVEQDLKKGSLILELNSGTGEDALYFASLGYHVHATDISRGMMQQLEKKAGEKKVEDLITSEICSFNDLGSLTNKGPYDLIFSNFAGLNCTAELDKVLASLDPLLKQGGVITLVLMPPFSLWETLLAFKGKFKTAFRRFNSRKGAVAHIEGVYFKCWYYKPSYLLRAMGKKYDLIRHEGLCTMVPPSYLETFPKKFPRLYSFLLRAEEHYKSTWPWRSCGDYYIISFRKK
jgi:ubiquinone/menaquinone biosynthesis C-methylase UbiE